MSKDIQYPRLTPSPPECYLDTLVLRPLGRGTNLLSWYSDHWAEGPTCSLGILISGICCPRGRNTLPDQVSAHIHTTMHCPLVTVLVCGYGVNVGLHVCC